MKNYRDIANTIFERRDRYVAAQKKKKQRWIRVSASVVSCALVALMGFELVNGSWFRHEPAVTDRVVYPSSTVPGAEVTTDSAETIPTNSTTVPTQPDDTSHGGTQGSTTLPTQTTTITPSTQTTASITNSTNDTEVSTTHSNTQGTILTQTTQPTVTRTQSITTQTQPTVTKTTTGQTKPTVTKTTTTRTQPTATKTTTTRTQPTVTKTTTTRTKPTVTRPTITQTKPTATQTKPTASQTRPTTTPTATGKVLITADAVDNTGVFDQEIMSVNKKYISRLLKETIAFYEGEDYYKGGDIVVYAVVVTMPSMKEYSDGFWNSNEEWAQIFKEMDEVYDAFDKEAHRLNPSWDGVDSRDIEIWTDTMRANYERYLTLIKVRNSIHDEYYAPYVEMILEQQFEALNAVSSTEPVDICENSFRFYNAYYAELTADAINALAERGGYTFSLAVANQRDYSGTWFDE